MENPKSRTWCMVLYPEDPTHVNCMSILAQSGYDYAAILHDKDTWEENESPNHEAGEQKKEHWHVVLKLKSPRYRNPVAEELGITPNYLEQCRDIKKALLYLVHDGYDTKYQYDVIDVLGPLVKQLETALMCDNEAERVIELVHIIDQSPGACTYREILLKACQAGLWSEFRKLGTGVKCLLDEHNMECYGDMRPPTEGYYQADLRNATFAGFVVGCESMKHRESNLLALGGGQPKY